MTPTITSQPANAFTSALVQLTALDGCELTVLAAAAQALAQAQAAPQPRFAPAEDQRLPTEQLRPICHGRARRQSSQRTNSCGTPGRQAAAGYGTVHSKSFKASIARIAAGSKAEQSHAGGAGRSGADAPRLGGRGRLFPCRDPLVDPELFSNRAYRRKLGPTVQGLLYAAGCEGLLALAVNLDEPLYKVGVTEGSTTEMRMSSLAATRYGSVVREGHSWREEVGFGHWEAAALPLKRRRGRNSPVGAALNAIAYERPASLPREVLDRALAAMLAPASLAAYAASSTDRAVYGRRGFDPVALERYSPAPLGRPQGRTDRARELVLLGPRADADRLAAVLEAVIAAHVMGHDRDG